MFTKHLKKKISEWVGIDNPSQFKRLNIGIILGLGITVLYSILNLSLPPRDWQVVFRAGALRDFTKVATPYWSLFLSYLPAQFPEETGYIIWTGIGVVLLIATLLYFKSSVVLVFLAYQLHWIIFYGQIDLYVIFGLPLGLWAVDRKHPYILGVALLLLLIKPQYGLLPAIILFFWSSERWKSSLVVIGGVILSFLVWHNWVAVLLSQWQIYRNPSLAAEFHHEQGNTSLHIPLWIGAILSLGVLFLPINGEKKILSLLSISFLISPYSTVYSQLAMLVFPLPKWFYVFAIIPWFVAIIWGPFDHWSWLAVFPLLVFCYTIFPLFQKAKQRKIEKEQKWK
ncbi:MAG TPA: DUF2029 domain-containing protein [Anaerolineae bacterium]|nr:DUF2029 domain-containing protein [Anaerolineae bacterium]